jgi:transposase-like protein
VISDAHVGIKAAVAKVMHATWQRCRVHFMRNALGFRPTPSPQLFSKGSNNSAHSKSTE